MWNIRVNLLYNKLITKDAPDLCNKWHSLLYIFPFGFFNKNLHSVNELKDHFKKKNCITFMGYIKVAKKVNYFFFLFLYKISKNDPLSHTLTFSKNLILYKKKFKIINHLDKGPSLLYLPAINLFTLH